MTAPLAAAPGYAPAPVRNPLAVAALILVILAIIAPIVFGIIATVSTATGPTQDASTAGWAGVAGVLFWLVGMCLASPIAIAGIVLAIIALRKPAARKVAAIVAIVVGAIPALFVFGIPVAWPLLFG
jgi:hypothetical protein